MIGYEQLKQATMTLEIQCGLLGNAVMDAALDSIHKKLVTPEQAQA